MAASIFLPQESTSRKSPIGRRGGVLLLAGFGIKICMQAGHLEIEDGSGPDRRKVRLARIGHGLQRLVCIGSDGYLSLAARRWLADQDISFSMLSRDDKVLAVTGPVRPSDAKLRRAQALALSNGAALRMARELIRQKLAAQEQVARYKLLDSTTADAIAQFAAELPGADSIASVRLTESHLFWGYYLPRGKCYTPPFAQLIASRDGQRADRETLRQLAGFSEREIRKGAGVHRDTIRLIRHGQGVKRSTYERIVKFLRDNVSPAAQNA
jgi:hypothetical protein